MKTSHPFPEVLLAGNGKEAIDRVKRYHIDLVIFSDDKENQRGF